MICNGPVIIVFGIPGINADGLTIRLDRGLVPFSGRLKISYGIADFRLALIRPSSQCFDRIDEILSGGRMSIGRIGVKPLLYFCSLVDRRNLN